MTCYSVQPRDGIFVVDMDKVMDFCLLLKIVSKISPNNNSETNEKEENT